MSCLKMGLQKCVKCIFLIHGKMHKSVLINHIHFTLA